MKLIHCADVHLASALETSLSPARARQRRGELLMTFGDMIRFAVNNGVRAVLIAGDLFDASVVPARAAEHAFDLMRGAPAIDFFYLRGNHDGASFSALPPNVFVPKKDGEWMVRRYEEENVTVALCDPPEEDEAYPDRLKLDEKSVNIAVLHGQAVSSGKSCGGQIALRDFAGKNIDYLALGHVHAYQKGELDGRGAYCYCGCLEGRGFDECGVKGFCLLETDAAGLRDTFVPFARRTLHEISADVSNCAGMHDLEAAVLAAVEPMKESDMVALHLTGACPPSLEKDTAYLLQLLRGRFFAARLYDDTRLLLDPADYADDLSLKGAFVREVLQSDMEERDKQRVIACGLSALCGGEVSF